MTNERTGQTLFDIDVVDYRDLPAEIFDGVIQRVNAGYVSRYSCPMPVAQMDALMQGLAVWAYTGKGPFELKAEAERHKGGDVFIGGARVPCFRYLEWVDEQFSEKRLGDMKYLEKNLVYFGLEVHSKLLMLKEEARRRLSDWPHAQSVPGDPEFKDPNRGTSGVSGRGPVIDNDNQSLHYGPGYDS